MRPNPVAALLFPDTREVRSGLAAILPGFLESDSTLEESAGIEGWGKLLLEGESLSLATWCIYGGERKDLHDTSVMVSATDQDPGFMHRDLLDPPLEQSRLLFVDLTPDLDHAMDAMDVCRALWEPMLHLGPLWGSAGFPGETARMVLFRHPHELILAFSDDDFQRILREGEMEWAKVTFWTEIWIKSALKRGLARPVEDGFIVECEGGELEAELEEGLLKHLNGYGRGKMVSYYLDRWDDEIAERPSLATRIRNWFSRND